MSLWRQFTRGLRVLANRPEADRDVADEVEHYLEQSTASFISRGLSPQDARRAALLELGNTTSVREQVRSYGWENVVGTFCADLTYAARRLRHDPGFTAVAVFTLALGIGAATAIFSAVNPILFESLPFPHAARLLRIWDTFQNRRSEVTFHTWREVTERNHSFDTLAVFEAWQPTITHMTQAERLDGQSVTTTYFRALGIAPTLGRDFQPADGQPGSPRTVILSDTLWRRRFESDPAVLGRHLRLNDDLYTVIGVMPRAFENVLAPSALLWSPLQYDPWHIVDQNTVEWGHHLQMVGRLRPGIPADQARRELALISRSAVPEFPRPRWASLQNGLIVDALQEQVTRGVRPALLAVTGAVILLLLIACVNVTNLLLARAAQRRGEFAMRAALGAGRSHLVRQLLTESLLLATLGGTLGMAVAAFGVRGLIALSPPELPRLSAISVNAAAFAFAFGITTFIGLAVGLVPALNASRRNPGSGLHQTSTRITGSHQWTRRTLVVAEVALALVLLISAGLLLRSLTRLFLVDPGFHAANLLTMQVQTSGHQFDTDANRLRFYASALEATRGIPGVDSAAFTSLLPLGDERHDTYGAHFEGDPPTTGADIFRYVITPGYLETMGIALRRGRLLNQHDTDSAPPATVISESLARHQFGAQDPLGRHVHIGPTDRPWYTIVGVVSDVKQTSLATSDPDAVYLTPAQSWFADEVMTLVIRARANAPSLASDVRKAIWAVVRIATMDQLLASTAAERHFALILFEAFGIVALVLAATGIFGVLSGSVTERVREIGVRTALGASRVNILGMVIRQGIALTVFGIVIGLAGAAIASRALISLLFGVSRLDAVTYLGVTALLLAVAAVACWFPAWRAARIDPAITLRAE